MAQKSSDKEPGGLGDFDTNVLSEFRFGDPDASADDLLIHCSQKIRGVPEFLSGTKNIVVGERGVGKSALFKLVAEGKFKIKHEVGDKSRRQLIVAIDEELDYTAIANAIEGRYVDKAGKPFGKYRFLWELYILSNVAEAIIEEDGEDEELKLLRQDIEAFFGIPIARKFSFSEFLKRIKVTAGLKIDSAGSYTPSVSVEQGREDAVLVELSDKQIASLKDRIRKSLKSRRIVATVLIDKVDDFVVGLEYEEQKKNVQALIECTQAMRLPELKLKIFLRADIFDRLDFEKIGYDKIVSQTIRLQWTPEDICELVALRLSYNFGVHKVPRPSWVLSDRWLNLDPSLKEDLKSAFRYKPEGAWDAFKNLGSLLKAFVRMLVHEKRRVSRAERKTNWNQELFLRVIEFIFPSKVVLDDRLKKKHEVAIEKLLSSFFKLGGDGPNPRLVLLFLTLVFEESVRYYKSNPDKRRISANGNNEFEVILKEHVSRGYTRLQEASRKTVAQLNKRWRRQLQKMFESLSSSSDERGLSKARIHELCGWDLGDEEFDEFIAFYTHYGLFIAQNGNSTPSNRLYFLPVVVCKFGMRGS